MEVSEQHRVTTIENDSSTREQKEAKKLQTTWKALKAEFTWENYTQEEEEVRYS